MSGIIDRVYKLVDETLGIEGIGKGPAHLKRVTSWQRLIIMPPGYEGLNLIGGIYQIIEDGWKVGQSGKAMKNWHLRHCEEYRTDSEETRFERSIIRNENWWNQIPAASGLMSSRSHRRMDIDLIYRHPESGAYDFFIELKIASNTPLHAAIEILIYGIFYIFTRVHADELGYIGRELELLEARCVNLCVLAPIDFYYHGNQSYNLKWLADSFDNGIKRFAEEKLSRLVKMGFRFEAFLPGDFEAVGPEAKGIIHKYSQKPLPDWVHRQDRHFKPRAGSTG